MAALTTAPTRAPEMTLGDALTIVGTWQAALAVQTPGAWSVVCRRAARKSRTAIAYEAWTSLGGRTRTDIADRLNAAGIFI
jgi:hypothetical protein